MAYWRKHYDANELKYFDVMTISEYVLLVLSDRLSDKKDNYIYMFSQLVAQFKY